jgi:hypothetical protein
MGRFLEYDHGSSVATKKFYPEPHHPRVSLMDVQKDFGENKGKDNQHGVELALLGFDCQVVNRPHSFGLLPLHVGYLFKTGYCKEPEASPTRDFPRLNI